MLETLGISPTWNTREALAAMLGAERVQNFALHVAIFAHVVMWRTHMGARPDALSSHERAAIARSGFLYAAELVAGGAFDPLCELIVANACAGGKPMHYAFAVIGFAQRADGAVPPFQGADDTFNDLYHSTLVAALATGFEPTKETT
jgi:hypothetical protein